MQHNYTVMSSWRSSVSCPSAGNREVGRGRRVGEVPRTKQNKRNSKCKHMWSLLSVRSLVTSIFRLLCFCNFSLPKGMTIHQELLMSRFSTQRNVLALSGKTSRVVEWMGKGHDPTSWWRGGRGWGGCELPRKKEKEYFAQALGLLKG